MTQPRENIRKIFRDAIEHARHNGRDEGMKGFQRELARQEAAWERLDTNLPTVAKRPENISGATTATNAFEQAANGLLLPKRALDERMANPCPGSFLDYLVNGTPGQTTTPPA